MFESSSREVRCSAGIKKATINGCRTDSGCWLTYVCKHRSSGRPQSSDDAKFAKLSYYLAIGVLLAPLVLGHTLGETPLQKISFSSLEERASQLRSGLDERFRVLIEQRKLKPGPGTDVSDVVARYIQPGTSFNDAEQILKMAGFRLDPRPGSPPPRAGVYGVTAVIRPFAEKFPAVWELIAYLEPKAPGDFSAVAKVSATFFVSLP